MNRIISSSVSKAICDDNLKQLKVLLNAGKRVDIQDNLGWTPLHAAVHKNRLDMVELLAIHPDAPLNARCYEGQTPLFLACQEKSTIKIISALLIAGADPNISNNENVTPLHIVQTAEAAKLLVTFGADVNAEDFNNYTPLHSAVEKNVLEVVNVLLRADADPNLVELNGLNPLMLSLQGYFDCTQRLLRVSNLNHVADDGWSALMLAINVGKMDIAYELIKRGADVNIIAQKLTALHLAVMRQEVELFLTLWDKMNFKAIAKTHSLFHLLLIHRWYVPERLDCLFKVLDTPLLYKMVDYRQSFLGFLFSFETDTKFEQAVCEIVTRILVNVPVVNSLEIISFIENSSSRKYKFELLDILHTKGKVEFDDPSIVLLATEFDPELVPKLLSMSLTINPIHIFRFFLNIERSDVHILKLVHYILHFCTPNKHRKTLYLNKLQNLDITNLQNVMYTLKERTERVIQIHKIVSYPLQDEERKLMLCYSEKISNFLSGCCVPSLKELSRDAVRAMLRQRCGQLRNCDLYKLGMPQDILDVVICKNPVNYL